MNHEGHEAYKNIILVFFLVKILLVSFSQITNCDVGAQLNLASQPRFRIVGRDDLQQLFFVF